MKKFLFFFENRGQKGNRRTILRKISRLFGLQGGIFTQNHGPNLLFDRNRIYNKNDEKRQQGCNGHPQASGNHRAGEGVQSIFQPHEPIKQPRQMRQRTFTQKLATPGHTMSKEWSPGGRPSLADTNRHASPKRQAERLKQFVSF